MSSLQLMVCFA